MQSLQYRNVCERHQHLVGSVAGSTEVVEKVRKPEKVEKVRKSEWGKRRGSVDLKREEVESSEEEEKKGGGSKETKNKVEVRWRDIFVNLRSTFYGPSCLGWSTSREANPPPLSL